MATSSTLLQEAFPRIWQVTNRIFPSNCYILETAVAGVCCLIDPGLDPDVIEDALGELGLRPSTVLCTHGHFDHAGSAAHFETKYGCEVYLHDADRKTLNASNFLLMAFKIAARVKLPVTVRNPDMNAPIDVGDHSARFYHTPGHTPGSCVIQIGRALFTGDTIYVSGVGLSNLPGENADMLRQSISAALDRLPHDGIVYPGHGPSASLQWIKNNNTALQSFLRAPQHDEVGQSW